MHSTSEVRTFYGSKNILAGPYNFKGLFVGLDLVCLRLKLGLGQGVGVES